MKTIRTISASCLIMAVGTLSYGQAQGYEVQRQFMSNPVGLCQGALPAFETAIRKRPLAVQNEGTTTAFVTCSFTSQGDWYSSADNPRAVSVVFTNASSKQVQISCTGVSGGTAVPLREYVVKTMTLAASGSRSMSWNYNDFATRGERPTFPSGLFSISCGLAPGVAINEAIVGFWENVVS
jgi:hypothetical protein